MAASAASAKSRLLQGLGVLLAGAAGACASPRGSIANLGELYDARTPPRAVYSTEVTNRGFWSSLGHSVRSLFSDTALQGTKELKAPVDFALENLAELDRAGASRLDRFEREGAVAIVAQIAQLDRARIVRARAYQSLRRQLELLAPPRRPFAAVEGDDAATAKAIDALLAVAEAPPERIDEVAAARGGELAAAAAALGALQPASFASAQKLLLLAAKSGRRIDSAGGDPSVVEAIAQAGAALAAHCCFLAARAEAGGRRDQAPGTGVADPANDARIAAGALLFSVDPVAATIEIGKAWNPFLDPLVRVAWLEQMEESGISADNVHPSLRPPLVGELASEDAAVGWWARHAFARLLGLDPERATIPQLKAAWLALGEWKAQPVAPSPAPAASS